MDENYVKSTELWLEGMKVTIDQKIDNLEHVKTQIALWEKEAELLKKQIKFDQEWIIKADLELQEYIKSYQND